MWQIDWQGKGLKRLQNREEGVCACAQSDSDRFFQGCIKLPKEGGGNRIKLLGKKIKLGRRKGEGRREGEGKREEREGNGRRREREGRQEGKEV